MNDKEIIKQFIELSSRTATALEGLQSAIRDINDTNVLHTATLKENTDAIKGIERYWGTIMKYMTIALIILAGVNTFGKLLGV